MSDIIKKGNQVTIRPDDDIISSSADILMAELLELIKDSPEEVTVDLSGVNMVDSSGISVLLSTHKSLSKSGGELRVINVSVNIYKLFTFMHLDQHFTVEKAK
jgi:anti-sigma B factor antagonist